MVRVKLFFVNCEIEPSWILINTSELKTTKDLTKYISRRFLGNKKHLKLFLSDCRIPKWESTLVLHDDDNIHVTADAVNDRGLSDSDEKTHKKRKTESYDDCNTEESNLVKNAHKKKKNKKDKRKELNLQNQDETMDVEVSEPSDPVFQKEEGKKGKSCESKRLKEDRTDRGDKSKNVSFNDNNKFLSLNEGVTSNVMVHHNSVVEILELTPKDVMVNEDTREVGESTSIKHSQEVVTPVMDMPKRKRKRTRRRKKNSNSAVNESVNGPSERNDQSWNDSGFASVHVNPPKTFRINPSISNMAGSYKKFSSDEEERNIHQFELENGLSSTPGAEAYTEHTRGQQPQNSSSDHQKNPLSNEAYSKYSTNVNQSSNTPDLQWGTGVNGDTSNRFAAITSLSEQVENRSENLTNEYAEPEIVKSVLANGVAVYTRQRQRFSSSYPEMSKANQLNAIQTNRSIILKNQEGKSTTNQPKVAASVKVSSVASDRSSSSSSSSDDDNDIASFKKSVANTENTTPVLTAYPLFKDYSRYPLLQGPPRPGDKIAFKILEMSSSYTPEVSAYKEAKVKNYDYLSQAVELEIISKDQGRQGGGKFDIDMEDEEVSWTSDLNDQNNHVLQWTSLLEPRLIT